MEFVAGFFTALDKNIEMNESLLTLFDTVTGSVIVAFINEYHVT